MIDRIGHRPDAVSPETPRIKASQGFNRVPKVHDLTAKQHVMAVSELVY